VSGVVSGEVLGVDDASVVDDVSDSVGSVVASVKSELVVASGISEGLRFGEGERRCSVAPEERRVGRR
jgi:hypothetical protein